MIEERRRRLTSDMVEILSCIKDWELADKHLQHNLEMDTTDIKAIRDTLNEDGGGGGGTMVHD